MSDASSSSPHPWLESTWPDGAAFLDALDTSTRPPVLRQRLNATEAELFGAAPGEMVRIGIGFVDRGADFQLHVRLLEVAQEDQSVLLLLAFLPEEQDRLELVLACAEGDSLPYYHRRHRRFAVRVAVRVKREGERWMEVNAISIGAGGLALALGPAQADALKLGDALSLETVGSAKEPLRVDGRVVWCDPCGVEPAVGVEFRFASVEQRTETARRVAEIAEASKDPSG